MKNILFIIKSALFDFSRNKGRTFLTSLGIMIGVLSVVLLLALGLGLRKYISDQFDSLGANLLYIMPGSKKAYMSSGGIGGIQFDDKDVQKVKRVKGVWKVTPTYSKPGIEAKAGGKIETLELAGCNEEIDEIMNLKIKDGRLLARKDVEKRAKVAVISETTGKKLYGSSFESIGKKITFEGQSFKIIGTYQTKGGGGLGGGSMDAHIFVPNSALLMFNPDKKYYMIMVKAVSKEVIPQLKINLENALLKRYKKDQFSVMDQSEIMETVSSIFSIINTVLISIAAISLVVGGIGIMNIMYVTVSERIREIGIRRALGAQKNDILNQFLVESVFLSASGGIFGIILAYLIVFALQSIFPAYIDIYAVLLAFGVSSAIGIIFGVFPAKKAAELSPIDAIRYE